MNIMKKFLNLKRRAKAAIFLSGSGSNAEVLLADIRDMASNSPYEVAVLVTDRPHESRAKAIAANYNLPLVELDIKQFYLDRGENAIDLKTPERRQIREEWTNCLRKLIAPYQIDFGILAGFVPLTNLTGDFPCLNVHPGDLTVTDDAGRRTLAGLHCLPVERAILSGHRFLRSSVILAQPYCGDGKDDMDSGFIIGISAPVAVELKGHSLEELNKIAKARIRGTTTDDSLRELAKINLEKLKFGGDHVVFPAAARDFAAGKFAGEGDLLYYNSIPVKTVEYSPGGHATPIPK